MARPERNNVDYFPFYCEEGKKMFYLEETYGNDGFAVFVKILRELAKTDYHYLNLSKNTTMMFLSAKCKVDKKILESIINDLVELDKFDSVLWNENKIIWCQDFIDSIQDAYIKRKNNCITYEGLLHLLISLGVRKQNKGKLIGCENPQSKEKDTKVKEIIEYLNSILNSKYKCSSEKTKTIINARLNEGFNIDNFKTVINKKFKEWDNTDMSKYLRPETLFGTKFESYLNQKINNNGKKTTQKDQSDFSIPDTGWDKN